MKIVTFLILGAMLFAIFRTSRTVRRCETPEERGFIIRTSAACWLLAFLFLVALAVLPNKARLIMMLPAFFIAVSIAKARRNSLAQLRRRQAQAIDIEKMKRVN